MYEVWATQGQNSTRVAYYVYLSGALAYVKRHEGEASYGIKYPNGEWHKWDENDNHASPRQA